MLVIYFNSLNAILNLASASIIVIRDSKDIKVLFILFYIILTNYNYKSLVTVRKSVIFLNKFQELVLKKGSKIAKEGKKK